MFSAFKNILTRPDAGGGPAVITAAAFVASYSDSSDTDAYSFAACDFGAADADRHIVVVVGHRTGSARTISSATIGGVSASVDVSAVGGSGIDSLQVISAAVPSGATGTVAITLSGASQRMGIGVYRVIKSGALVVHDTDTNINDIVASLAIDIEDNGVVIGGSFYRVGQANVWSGITRDSVFPILDGNAVGGCCASSGIVTPAETARAITVTNTAYITAVGLVSYK